MIIEPESHHLVKTVLIPQIIKLLMENYAINENKALQIMYTSPTGRCLMMTFRFIRTAPYTAHREDIA